MSNFEKILKNNRQWSSRKISEDRNYFKRHAGSQSPKYLFIGCADSRIPAETILGLEPGEIFVHRNVANQVHTSDINTLSVVQYAVDVLKVQDIIIMGHYGCGGVKAAMTKNDFGALEAWLSHIRSTRIHFAKLLKNQDEEDNFNLLCELNVKAQVYDMATIPIVQKAWARGQPLRIHGLIYRLDNGKLKDLGLSLNRLQQLPEAFWIHTPESVAKKEQEAKEKAFKKQKQVDSILTAPSSIRGSEEVSIKSSNSGLADDKELQQAFGGGHGQASCQLI